MSRFSYKAKDSQGKAQKGFVDATNIKGAVGLLHEHGFFIIQIKEITAGIFTLRKSSTISFNDLVHLTRQLSTMITAGLTLVEALSILRQQLKAQSFIQLVSGLEEEVKGGKSFSQVLEKYPKVFPPVYIALIKAGEASGRLDVILSRLADNLEKTRDFRNKVRGALIYPAIVIIGMFIVSAIVMTVVVPRLTSLYNEFGINLPLPTQILILVSNFANKSWWLIILLISLFIVLLIKFKQTLLGQHIFGVLSLSLPIVGHLLTQSILVEVTRTLSILIDGGVPILTALEISKEATSNILFKEAFIDASKKVEKGYPLSTPLLENKIFPPILGQMAGVGEQTGKLGESLLKLSHYFETEADNAVRSLTILVEPLIMVVLGVGVAFLLIAVLLPIYSLTTKF